MNQWDFSEKLRHHLKIVMCGNRYEKKKTNQIKIQKQLIEVYPRSSTQRRFTVLAKYIYKLNRERLWNNDNEKLFTRSKLKEIESKQNKATPTKEK